MYLPQQSHPAFGVARINVRDGNDEYLGGSASEGYVDSDGLIANNSGPRPPPYPLYDGDWHMLTVTSQPSSSSTTTNTTTNTTTPGYRVYLDGDLKADVNAATTVVGKDGAALHIDGGDPLQLTGNMVLCSRSDDSGGERHFDGDLAYLSMWDVVLQEVQVKALFSAVQVKMAVIGMAPRSEAETPALSTARRQPSTTITTTTTTNTNTTTAASTEQRYSVNGQPCVFPTVYNGVEVQDCIAFSQSGSGEIEFCPVDEAGGDWEACSPRNAAATLLPPPPESEAFFDPGAENNTDYSINNDYYDYEEAAAASMKSASRAPLFSADGRRCLFPLTYKDQIQVDNCVSFGGEQFCWVGESGSERIGEWAGCDMDALKSPPEPGSLGVGPSVVHVLQLQQPVRMTTDGEMCELPVVRDGKVIDDCVEVNGKLSCTTTTAGGSDDEWKVCEENADAVESDVLALVVAERESVSRQRCIFPAVSR